MGHEARGHEELELLLPWYVNGTLEAAERAALDDHLAGCARCRAELAREEGLVAVLRAAEDVAPAPHPAQLARLMGRLDGEPRAERPPRRRRRRASPRSGPAPRGRCAGPSRRRRSSSSPSPP